MKEKRVAKAVSKPISLYPSHVEFAKERETKLGIGLSKYVQKLIDYDRANNVISKILAEHALKAA
jgi:hypothetical protein